MKELARFVYRKTGHEHRVIIAHDGDQQVAVSFCSECGQQYEFERAGELGNVSGEFFEPGANLDFRKLRRYCTTDCRLEAQRRRRQLKGRAPIQITKEFENV